MQLRGQHRELYQQQQNYVLLDVQLLSRFRKRDSTTLRPRPAFTPRNQCRRAADNYEAELDAEEHEAVDRQSTRQRLEAVEDARERLADTESTSRSFIPFCEIEQRLVRWLNAMEHSVVSRQRITGRQIRVRAVTLFIFNFPSSKSHQELQVCCIINRRDCKGIVLAFINFKPSSVGNGLIGKDLRERATHFISRRARLGPKGFGVPLILWICSSVLPVLTLIKMLMSCC
jgi:hypothetical protein